MSQENVEVVRRVFAHFERGDFTAPELSDLLDPDIRIEWLGGVVGMETETVGLREATEFIQSWRESFERITQRAERIVDAGDDQVAVVGVWHGRGKASGATAEWRYGSVYTLREGKVVDIATWENPDEALEAAGLRE